MVDVWIYQLESELDYQYCIAEDPFLTSCTFPSIVARNQSRPLPRAPNRIELIPVEWYNKIHSKSSTLKNHLLSTTLPTIPKLRKIANDVVFDILMYMTPEFCEKVLNCVTNQIVDLYNGFQLIHPYFAENG